MVIEHFIFSVKKIHRKFCCWMLSYPKVTGISLGNIFDWNTIPHCPLLRLKKIRFYKTL